MIVDILLALLMGPVIIVAWVGVVMLIRFAYKEF